MSSYGDDTIGRDVVVIKLGGSSITDKANIETLDRSALRWVARTLAYSVDEAYLAPGSAFDASTRSPRSRQAAFIVVHGAGSFGHHTAKEFGLRGQHSAPSTVVDGNDFENVDVAERKRRHAMNGLAKTRSSVQKLNQEVVSHLITSGINAVGLSPCITIPGMQAHGGDETGAITLLVGAIRDALKAGLIPVIHGDAGLYGNYERGRASMGAGILGGDTLVDAISTHEMLKANISQAIFMTDVNGVYTKDPNVYRDAELLMSIEIDRKGKLVTELSASGSTHVHDVTGGLKTKLEAAAKIAMTGTEVLIVKYGSTSAEQAVCGEKGTITGTIVRSSS